MSIVITSLFTSYSLSIFMLYLGIHLSDLKATALIISLVFAIRNFFQIFFRVPLAEMSQIIGRKPMIIFGLLLFSIALLFMYLANHWITIFIATSCVAIGMSCYFPAMFAYVGDISTDNFGKINAIVFQGGDIGVILGSLLIKNILEDNIVDLRGVFAISAVIGFYGFFLSLFFLPETLEIEHRKMVNSKFTALKDVFIQSFSSLKKITKQQQFRFIYAFQGLISFGEYFLGSFFPLLIVYSLGYAKSEVANITFYSTLLIFFIKPYLGSISDKFGYRYPVFIALLVTGFLLWILTIITSLWFVIFCYAALMACIFTSYLAVNGATSNSAGPKQRGVALGALGFYVSFGRTISSILLGPFWEYLENKTGDRGESIRYIFRTTSTILIIFAFLLFYLTRKIAYIKFEKNEFI